MKTGQEPPENIARIVEQILAEQYHNGLVEGLRIGAKNVLLLTQQPDSKGQRWKRQSAIRALHQECERLGISLTDIGMTGWFVEEVFPDQFTGVSKKEEK